MGIGDWIMATADARRAHQKHGVRVVFGDGQRWFWSEVFENNPIIAKKTELHTDEQFSWVTNYPQNRPYIAEIVPGRFIYRPDFKVEQGEIYLSDKEKRPPGDFIIVEPNVKPDMTGPNKKWPWTNWVKLLKQLDGDIVQLGPPGEARGQVYYPGSRILKGARHIPTKTFREALSWLSAAKLLITTDGALHHAAAAMNIPAVVLWGGAASPDNLGYDKHTNIWHGAEPCGTYRGECAHCKAAMESITVNEVLRAVHGTAVETCH